MNLARNRYGWEKRAKEMARKQKHDEKLKRRQGKVAAPEAETDPVEVVEETGIIDQPDDLPIEEKL
jgi:hypothetical protein